MISSPNRADEGRDGRPVVFITGSEGLIGSRVVKALSPRYRIVAFDVKPAEDRGPESTFIQCDLTKDQSVADAVRKAVELVGPGVASVIHLAAYYDFTGEPSPLYDELTVQGTRRLLRRLQDLSVEQFVFSSSLLVMKPAESEQTIDENSPVEGNWDYPRSKLEAEQVIREEHGPIPAVILRIAGVYDDDGHSIPVGRQIARIYEKKIESYLFPGNADHGQPFVHLDDLIDCFVRTVDRRGDFQGEEVLLVAEPDVVSYRELQEIIGATLHEREWPTIRIPKVMAKAGAWVKDKTASEEEPAFIKPWMVDLADMHYPVDVSKAKLRLGWEAKRRLRTTLPIILHRLQKDPRSWYELNKLPVPDDVA